MTYNKLKENFNKNWWQVSASVAVFLNPKSSDYYRGLALGLGMSYLMEWKAESTAQQLVLNSVDITP
jgi:hypothetical protein